MIPPLIRKRRAQEDDNGWALTLADMMTLLLCFFVLLLTVTHVDKDKYEAMSSVMAEAMGGKDAPSNKAATGTQKNTNTPQAAQESTNLFELQLELAALIGKDRDAVDLKMRSQPHAVAISLGDRILFDLGKADLKPRAKELLGKLAGPLTRTPYALLIEGHSDNLPIHSSQFPSNWELSSARASAVARFFIDRGFPKNRVEVLGLADTRPIANNASEQGRSRNRRVVILVQPD
jgi:chemotaxis protein MotB